MNNTLKKKLENLLGIQHGTDSDSRHEVREWQDIFQRRDNIEKQILLGKINPNDLEGFKVAIGQIKEICKLCKKLGITIHPDRHNNNFYWYGKQIRLGYSKFPDGYAGLQKQWLALNRLALHAEIRAEKNKIKKISSQ